MNGVTRQLLRLVARSGVWRGVGKVHGRLYAASRGRIGHRSGGFEHLLLTTTGRRTGRPRTVPLTFMPEGDRFILVASNGGADHHPAWWLNLSVRPEATVVIGDRSQQVVARRADGAEHHRLWRQVKAQNPFYGLYEQITDRPIPVVILEPTSGER